MTLTNPGGIQGDGKHNHPEWRHYRELRACRRTYKRQLMTIRRELKNPPCPSCGSKRCAQILYGRVAETQQLQEAIAAGKVVLGGCLFSEAMPRWRCLACGKAWGQKQSNRTN